MCHCRQLLSSSKGLKDRLDVPSLQELHLNFRSMTYGMTAREVEPILISLRHSEHPATTIKRILGLVA